MAFGFLQATIDFVRTAPIIIQIVSGVLFFFMILFVFRFLIPAIWMRLQLSAIIRRLRRIKRTKDRDLTPIFAQSRTLSHLWTEYQHTLHKQGEHNQAAGEAAVILRSTVPAGTIFTAESLVDSRLATEFFKHLPGLFTGIGIIGTFSGLIQGLQAFKVSENAAKVRTSLEVLMHGVSEAFLVSAVAIGSAMVTTVFERWLVTGLYKKVEEITFELDAMFESGAGEEYLARLVAASEDTADQSKILKDALITDLERILADLSARQIDAQVQGGRDLATQIVNGLTVGLQEPLKKIAGTFEQTSQGNTQAVTTLLTDVLTGFSQRLEELFGGQISGINQLQQQTIDALKTAVAKLDQMASNVDAAGTKTSETMAQKLADAIGSMEARQQIMNDRMTEFVEQIRALIREEQSETSRKMQSTLAEIGEAVRLQIVALKDAGDQATGSHSEREDRLAARADENITKLASTTERLMVEIRTLTGEIQNTANTMRTITSDAVSRMNSGAETLSRAAIEFTTAGQSVTGVLQQATSISSSLNEAAGSLSSSSTVLQGVVADHAKARETFAKMLADLQTTIENAKRDASITSDILARIESSSQKLGQVQKDADEYLDGVSRVLTEVHSEFSESLKKVLGEGYNEFYTRLSTATALLRTAIEELATTVEEIPAARTKTPTEPVS